MNFNFSIIGVCIGLVVGLSFPMLSNYVQTFLQYESVYNHSVHTKDISSDERFSSSMWCSYRVDGVEDMKQLSLSTVQNHSGVNLKLIIIRSPEYLHGQNISYLETESFMIKSFKSDNIMHVIHDDLIPLFVTYKELCHGNISLCISSYQLVLIDSNDHRPYFEWYMHFSVYKPILISSEKHPLCIKRGYFGLSNSSIWYQYGFKNTQGPLVNNFINSFLLMEFTEFIRQRFGLLTEKVSSTNLDNIVFFSRKINRKILNEDVMEVNMKDIAQIIHNRNITVINLDLSTNNSYSIIKVLHRTRLLVGIHGSAMILAIFLEPGSYVIELFPFGIQPEFVSPLRALCKLQNVYYKYESWVNRNESNTRTHPDYSPLLGGIFHLENTKQNVIMNTKIVPAVKCCHDPLYLYRMFQDTTVDDSFFTLFRKVVSNYNGSDMSKQQVMKQNLEFKMKMWYFPPPVFNLSCTFYEGKLKLMWDHPFKTLGTEFSVATSNGILALTKQTIFSLNVEECDSEVCGSLKQTLSVWVKAVDGDKDSLDSYALCDNLDLKDKSTDLLKD